MRADFPERVLRHSLSTYDDVFADSQQANNTCDLGHDNLRRNPALLAEVVCNMAQLARPYSPDVIIGIPNGATNLGTSIADYLGIDALRLEKTDDDPFQLRVRGGVELLKAYRRVVLVEDVSNRRSTVRKALWAFANAGRISTVKASIAVLDRGSLGEKLSIPPWVADRAVVRHPIPAVLAADSELWRYAQRRIPA